jgi:tetratricopeptide (TPR) repeat protein
MIVATSHAQAKPTAPRRETPPDRSHFWREVIEPHGDEVRDLLAKARNVMRQPDDAMLTDADWAVDQRMRFFRDAYNLLRYARRLSPQNTEVLALLGRAADELGKTREALEVLEASIRVTGLDKASPEVAGRLGAIQLRLGNRDAAIRYLRVAQGPITPATAEPIVHLANALAARGEVTAAIDTLQNVLPSGSLGYYGQDVALVAFSLAVIYDRDEQRSAAFEVLDHMQAAFQQQYWPHVQGELAKMRFAPAEDQHYYLGLLYESLGHYAEARTEWALYAATTDSPWRGRALDHIAAIDAQRRANPGARPATQLTPTITRSLGVHP